LTVTVPVRDNVAAVTLPQRGTAARDTWHAADGRVIADETLRVPPQALRSAGRTRRPGAAEGV